ncbi:YbaB/EbfC family nucleoid-associated protein [Streptomyces sp. NPDC056160]|uniref:YbaB/EbfC family nucleoid-associated protein n=1 Tax=Streptomyces sp. NPDC056160 TaxID=3345731 RepID=UPI0035D6D369
MNGPTGSELQDALAGFTKKHESLLKAREEMKAISVTVRSKDGCVEATVGAGGEASGLRFPDNKFKEMTGKALATSVLEALSRARAEASARATAILRAAGGSPPGEPGSSLLDRLDLDRLLDTKSFADALSPRREEGTGRG